MFTDIYVDIYGCLGDSPANQKALVSKKQLDPRISAPAVSRTDLSNVSNSFVYQLIYLFIHSRYEYVCWH